MLPEVVLSSHWTLTEILMGLALGFVSLTASYVIYQRWFAPLADSKGPFWASLSRALLVYHALQADLHRYTPTLHEKYGEQCH